MERTNKFYVVAILVMAAINVISIFVTIGVMGEIHKSEINTYKESYSQVWFERNMYAENYYKSIGKDDLAKSFSVNKE